MLLYAIILFAAAALTLYFAFSIRGGNLALIHDYHRKRLDAKNKVQYAKLFFLGLLVIAVGMIASGAVSLIFGKGAVWAALIILFAGLAAGIGIIIHAQKKYNGGLF